MTAMHDTNPDLARCTFRRCPNRATHAIQGEYDREPWYGCDLHWPAMAKALGLGQRIDYPVAVTPLHGRRNRRPAAVLTTWRGPR